ncbi:hypothetical protein ACIGII_02095 [Stenotrophomonas sp. NPDC077420]|uniref:hypothetical protein n=2 Tax=Stenotrophomonas TaxID=40323 RepID=UPI0037D79C81
MDRLLDVGHGFESGVREKSALQSNEVHDMKLLPYLLLTSSFAVSASEVTSYRDRTELDSLGNRLVVRTSSMVSPSGDVAYVEQRLDQIDETTYVYDHNAQTEATKKFHEEFCAQRGLLPSIDGESILSGPDAISGWSCHLSKDQLGERSDLMVPDHFRGDRSSDYVIARAPSGSAAAGANFQLYGTIQAKSSQAGPLSSSVSGYNERCRFSQVWNYGGEFSTFREISVNCIVHQPQFISTRIEACIPRQCGQATGTFSIRESRAGQRRVE